MKAIDLSKKTLERLGAIDLEELRCLDEKDIFYSHVERYKHLILSSPEIVKRCLGLDELGLQVQELDLSSLEGIYQFASEDVIRFLESNSFLIDLLEEAAPKIREYFGADTEVLLELCKDPEGHEVFARIITKLEPKEALAILDCFDDEWWLDVSPRAKRALNFALRYV